MEIEHVLINTLSTYLAIPKYRDSKKILIKVIFKVILVCKCWCTLRTPLQARNFGTGK